MIFTFSSTPIIQEYGELYTNVLYIGALLVGLILTLLVKNDLRRQAHGSAD